MNSYFCKQQLLLFFKRYKRGWGLVSVDSFWVSVVLVIQIEYYGQKFGRCCWKFYVQIKGNFEFIVFFEVRVFLEQWIQF